MSPKRQLVIDGAIFFVFATFFVLLKLYGLNPAVSDENIYFYDCKLMTEGFWPYRDFFFAHPPLHLVPGWLLFLFTGADFTAGKLLPLIEAVAAGFFIFATARNAAGRTAGIASLALFWFAHDVLRASSHWTGITLSITWLAAGIFAAMRDKPATAGALFGLGACTGFYVFPSFLMAATLTLFVRPRDALRMAVAFAIVFGTINLFFIGLAGDAYLDAVYRYHLDKPGESEDALAKTLPKILFHNFFLFMAPVYLLPFAAADGWHRLRATKEPASGKKKAVRKSSWTLLREGLDPKHDEARALATWSILFFAGYMFFLTLQPKIFDFYFLLPFVPAALAAGLFAARIRDALVAAFQKRSNFLVPAAAGAALLVGFVWYPYFEHDIAYFERERGKTSTYDFPKSVAPAAFHDFVRSAFFTPDRTIGKRYSGLQFYLWHESRAFEEAREAAAWLRAHSRSTDALFGDSNIAPIVALWADRPIAAKFVDTNAMRFRSGITPPSEALATLRETYETSEPLVWIVAGRGRGFIRVDEFAAYVRSDFHLVKSFPTRYAGQVQIHLRNGVDRPVD